MECLYQTLLQESVQKRRQKVMTDDSKETVSSRPTGLTPMWTHRLWQHAQSLHRFKSNREGKRIWSPTSNQEVICNWYPLVTGETIFSNGVSLGISITLQVRLHAQEELTNTKQAQWYFGGFVCLFVSCCFVWAFFFRLVILLYVLIFIFVGFLFVFLDLGRFCSFICFLGFGGGAAFLFKRKRT